MATTSFLSSKMEWHDSTPVTSHATPWNLVQLLLPPKLHLHEHGSTLVTSHVCILYFRHGSTLVTSHAYSFTFSMVQLLLPPMLNPLSLAWFNSRYFPCLTCSQHSHLSQGKITQSYAYTQFTCSTTWLCYSSS